MGRRRRGRTEEVAGLSLLDLIRDLVLLLFDGKLVVSHESDLADSTARSGKGKEGSIVRARSSRKESKLPAF